MGGGSSIPKGNLAQRGVSAVAGGIDSLTGSESGSGIASKAVDKLGIGKPKTGPAWKLQSWDIHARDKCEPWLIGYALGKFRGTRLWEETVWLCNTSTPCCGRAKDSTLGGLNLVDQLNAIMSMDSAIC
eukprot:s87_g18.t1